MDQRRAGSNCINPKYLDALRTAIGQEVQGLLHLRNRSVVGMQEDRNAAYVGVIATAGNIIAWRRRRRKD